MPDMADDDYLVRWGRIFNVPQKPATAARGAATFSGLPLAIPSGLPLLAEDKTTVFTTTAGATGGRFRHGGDRGGAARRGCQSRRRRGLHAWSGDRRCVACRHGGSARDQRRGGPGNGRRMAIAHSHAGQGRCKRRSSRLGIGTAGRDARLGFPAGARGAGAVDVAFVMDGQSPIIPAPADVANVQAAIDALRPVTVDCRVFAPAGDPLMVVMAQSDTHRRRARRSATRSMRCCYATHNRGHAVAQPADGGDERRRRCGKLQPRFADCERAVRVGSHARLCGDVVPMSFALRGRLLTRM
jgi:hypothetical protein